jgi:hypothetical protein
LWASFCNSFGIPVSVSALPQAAVGSDCCLFISFYDKTPGVSRRFCHIQRIILIKKGDHHETFLEKPFCRISDSSPASG